MQLQTDGLLLPVLSLALLGGGPEGADVLREIGYVAENFGADLAAVLDQLGASDDPDARQQRAITERLAEIGRETTGWIAVTSMTGSVYPNYVLRRGDAAVVVRPQGPAVEWLLIKLPDVVDVVEAAIGAFPEVLVSARKGGAYRASVLVRDGEAHVAARSQEALDAVSDGARRGLDGAVARLLDLIA